jgi:hypothetical protein
VIGSKVKYQGHDAIIAREVKIGAKVLTLRDCTPQKLPRWLETREFKTNLKGETSTIKGPRSMKSCLCWLNIFGVDTRLTI